MAPLYSLAPEPLKRFLSSPARYYATLGLLATCCYLNSLQGQLVHDDIFAIRDNNDVRPSTPLATVFQDDFWGAPMSSETSHKSYRPLTVLTFRLNYLLHGLDPWGYHAVNAMLHALVTMLFGFLCKHVAFRHEDLAFLSAALFGTHPVHTEAVAGIVGRADILACMFFLLSFLSYRSCTESSRIQFLLKLLCCLVCGLAAMLFKEHGITVFGVCIGYDCLVASRSEILATLKRGRASGPKLCGLAVRTSCLGVATLLLLFWRVRLNHGHLPHFSAQDNPASFHPHLSTRTLTYLYLLAFNGWLLVAPVTLCYDWQMGSIPLVESLSDPRNMVTVAFLLTMAGLCLTALGRPSAHQRTVAMAMLVASVPFLPASNLFFRVGFVVAERILYIPSMGYCILVIHGVNTLVLHLFDGTRSKQVWGHRGLWYRLLPSLTTTLLILLFGVKTMQRNAVWSTRESLFRSGLGTVPHNAKVHYNYANYLKDTGQSEEAIKHYREAIRYIFRNGVRLMDPGKHCKKYAELRGLSSDHDTSHNNLGTLLSGEEAEFHFRQAVKHNPNHFKAFFNLGNNLLGRGRRVEAETSFRQSLNINPNYTDALTSLAFLLADNGKLEEGQAMMQRAASIAPNQPDVLCNFASYLVRMGKNQEALEVFTRVLHLQPTHTTAMLGQARLHRSMGHDREAEDLFLKVLHLTNDTGVYQSLGALYFNTGRYQQALATLGGALKRDPYNEEISCIYAQSLTHLGREPECCKHLKELLAVKPNSSCAHLHLATSLVHDGKLEEALLHSSLSVELERGPLKGDCHSVHAGILRELGRLDEAEKHYRTAASLMPAKAGPHLNLGALLHIKRDYTGARRYYETALQLDPSNAIVLENLKKLERAERAQAATASRGG